MGTHDFQHEEDEDDEEATLDRCELIRESLEEGQRAYRSSPAPDHAHSSLNIKYPHCEVPFVSILQIFFGYI